MKMMIDTDQIKAMEDQKNRAFYDDLKTDILAFMIGADPAVPTDTVEERVDAAFKAAEADQMLSEQQITRYSYILAALPLNYREDADYEWMVSVLTGGGSSDAKLDRITAVLNASGQS